VTAAIDILSVMGDHFLGKKGVSGTMGVFDIIGLLSSKFGRDGIRVLICECRMRTEIRSGLLSSELDSSRGSVPPVCSSLD
jgi:hypothetical protein